MDFAAGYDLVALGRDEEGGEVVGNLYFVSAWNAAGERWRLYTGRDRLAWEEDDGWDYCFVEKNEVADKLAASLADRLNCGEMAYGEAAEVVAAEWEGDFPVYGSEAHDEEALIEWERSMEGGW